MFLLRFLNFLSPLPKKVQSSHWKNPVKKTKTSTQDFFLWRKRSSPKSGGLLFETVNLPARNVISGKNALPVRSYKQFF